MPLVQQRKVDFNQFCPGIGQVLLDLLHHEGDAFGVPHRSWLGTRIPIRMPLKTCPAELAWFGRGRITGAVFGVAPSSTPKTSAENQHCPS